jgi:hypothetical protein
MTTKTGQKSPREHGVKPSQQEVQAAYQCHTLAQILYGRIAAMHPWLLQPGGMPTHQQAAPTPPAPWSPTGRVFG